MTPLLLTCELDELLLCLSHIAGFAEILKDFPLLHKNSENIRPPEIFLIME